MLQLYQMREMAPTLLPVLATMLHFSPAEVAKCQEATADAPAGGTPDDAGGTLDDARSLQHSRLGCVTCS